MVKLYSLCNEFKNSFFFSLVEIDSNRKLHACIRCDIYGKVFSFFRYLEQRVKYFGFVTTFKG